MKLEFNFTPGQDKQSGLDYALGVVKNSGFKIVSHDFNRSWGGFITLSEDDKNREVFMRSFFQRHKEELAEVDGRRFILKDFTPKILIICPQKSFGESLYATSFQYHNQRSELWKVLKGPINVARSLSDEYPGYMSPAIKGDHIKIGLGERHRLIGNRIDYTVLAEAWIHNLNYRSDEDDIVRLKAPDIR